MSPLITSMERIQIRTLRKELDKLEKDGLGSSERARIARFDMSMLESGRRPHKVRRVVMTSIAGTPINEVSAAMSQGHVLHTIEKYIFCTRCGGTTTGGRCVLLNERCLGRPSGGAGHRLRLLAKGQDPYTQVGLDGKIRRLSVEDVLDRVPTELHVVGTNAGL